MGQTNAQSTLWIFITVQRAFGKAEGNSCLGPIVKGMLKTVDRFRFLGVRCFGASEMFETT